MNKEKTLHIYMANWCPHCRAALKYLGESGIKFVQHDMDRISPEEEKKVIDANGGDDWVVPTLECEGKWIPGRAFRKERFEADLKTLGVL
jgi:mycoredoxin